MPDDALRSYEIIHDGKAIVCLRCGLVSHNREDVRNRYCVRCHVFHDDNEAEVHRCQEFDCKECGRHIFLIAGPLSDTCGACQCVPGWVSRSRNRPGARPRLPPPAEGSAMTMISLEEMTRRGAVLQQALTVKGLSHPEAIGIMACGMGCSLMELPPVERVLAVVGILKALEKLGITIDQHGRVVLVQ